MSHSPEDNARSPEEIRAANLITRRQLVRRVAWGSGAILIPGLLAACVDESFNPLAPVPGDEEEEREGDFGTSGNDQFVAEIAIFPFNFAPTGWAFCDGQLLPISQNTALFALLGTYYGGDGKSTFALPNLQGAAPMQTGQGQGLSERFLGEMSGVESITLLQSEIPFHTHTVTSMSDPGTLQVPAPDRVLARSSSGNAYQTNTSANLTMMAPQSLALAGGGLPHNNMQPYLTLNFCIALQGIFPQRP